MSFRYTQEGICGRHRLDVPQVMLCYLRAPCLIRRVPYIFVAAYLVIGAACISLIAPSPLHEDENDHDQDDRRTSRHHEQPKAFHRNLPPLISIFRPRKPQVEMADAL